MARHNERQASNRLPAALHAALLSTVTFLRGDGAADDRGSEAVEKALMTILAVTVGGLVTVGLVALVNRYVGLF